MIYNNKFTVALKDVIRKNNLIDTRDLHNSIEVYHEVQKNVVTIIVKSKYYIEFYRDKYFNVINSKKVYTVENDFINYPGVMDELSKIYALYLEDLEVKSIVSGIPVDPKLFKFFRKFRYIKI